jgi:hypothetical protein
VRSEMLKMNEVLKRDLFHILGGCNWSALSWAERKAQIEKMHDLAVSDEPLVALERKSHKQMDGNFSKTFDT